MGRPTANLETWLAVDGEPVRLVETHLGEPDATLERLADLAPWLVVERIAQPSAKVPTLVVRGAREHGSIVFRGPVRGRLLEALVVLIVELRTGCADWDGASAPALLRTIAEPHELSVVATPSCPYCPSVVAAALRFAQASPRLAVAVVRADSEPSEGVRATPTVLLDGRLIATGPVAEHRLAELVLAALAPA